MHWNHHLLSKVCISTVDAYRGLIILFFIYTSYNILLVFSLNEVEPRNDDGNLLYGIVNVVQPGEIRQYLYCLKPNEEARLNYRVLRGESNIGKLDLVWRVAFKIINFEINKTFNKLMKFKGLENCHG